MGNGMCQACKQKSVVHINSSDSKEQPYILCSECNNRIERRSLRPIEWYNLAVIHSPRKFLLHDDFYDEDGVATQPEEDVEYEGDHLAPTLEDVQDNMDLLLDFANTKWFLEEPVIQSLSAFNASLLLNHIQRRYESDVTVPNRDRLLEITAEVLVNKAETWVRSLWQHYDEIYQIPLSVAAARCLPIDEGFQLVIERLASVEEKNLPRTSFACLHRFRSQKVLNWMENHVSSVENIPAIAGGHDMSFATLFDHNLLLFMGKLVRYDNLRFSKVDDYLFNETFDVINRNPNFP